MHHTIHSVEHTNSLVSNVNILREENEKKLKKYQDRIKEITAIVAGSKRDIDVSHFLWNHRSKAICVLNMALVVYRWWRIRNSDTMPNWNHWRRNYIVATKIWVRSYSRRIMSLSFCGPADCFILFFNISERLNFLLKNVNASEHDNAKIYGDEMPRLLSDIESLYKKSKFSMMPLGPIGNHVEILDGKYRNVVEDSLSNVLNAFLVDNAQDSSVLRNLIATKYPQLRLSIVKMKFRNRVYDTGEKRVPFDRNGVLLMDVLKVENPNILNCLIDQCSADTIFFVDDYDYATHITSIQKNVPKNLTKVILLKPYSEIYPAPNYRIYSRQERSSKYLRVDASQRER